MGRNDFDSEGQRLLAFERQWWQGPGAKEQAIRDLFGVTPTRYYQLLGQLIDQPEALAYDPVTVKRLRGLRDRRAAGRARARAA